jgi:dihydrofolate reductase
MERVLVAAVSENGIIGKNGGLPWKLPRDLNRFAMITRGHAIIMGRKTWESLPKKPLPGRVNIVVSRTHRDISGANTVGSLFEAFNFAKHSDSERACVIGGAEIFRDAFPMVTKCFITRIHQEVEGDIVFPELVKLPEGWRKIYETETERPDTKHSHPFSFAYYEKLPSLS